MESAGWPGCQLGNREERTPQVDSVHKPGRPQGTKWSEARALGTEAVMHVPHDSSTQSLSASRCVCDGVVTTAEPVAGAADTFVTAHNVPVSRFGLAVRR